jgi:putative oxidoreductase
MGIRDIALLASRAVLGSYLAAHGAQKLFGTFGGHGIEPTAAAFERIGLRPGGQRHPPRADGHRARTCGA